MFTGQRSFITRFGGTPGTGGTGSTGGTTGTGGTGCRVSSWLSFFSCSSCITGFFSSWRVGGAEKKASTPFPEDCFRLFVRSSNSSGGRLLLAIDYFLNHCLIRCCAFVVGELHDNRGFKPRRFGNPHCERDIGIKHSDTCIAGRRLKRSINLFAVQSRLVIF